MSTFPAKGAAPVCRECERFWDCRTESGAASSDLACWRFIPEGFSGK